MAAQNLVMGAIPGQRASEAHMLVTQLYDPANQRNPVMIHEIQKRLQELQKGDNAWEVADSLLREPSAHHRFMGALTFTVKVNVSGGELNEATILQILERLINHLITIVNEAEQAMVVRKLASSLVTIFKHPASNWKRALWQVAASLANGSFVSEQQSQTIPFSSGVLPNLDTQKTMALVFFSVALAEETLRLEAEPQDLVGPVIQRSSTNIRDAFLLVQYILPQISHPNHPSMNEYLQKTLGSEIMSSWKAWLGVCGNHPQTGDENVHELAVSCGQDIMNTLRVPILSEPAASILTQVFESRRSAFDDKSLWILSHILSDSIVTGHILAITSGEEGAESLTFVDLLVAYVSHLQLNMFSHPIKPENEKILTMVHDIFKTPGYAAIDDSATPRVLEFWNEIAECLSDELTQDDPRYEIVKAQLAKVVLGLFNKLLYPSADDLADWSDEERGEFNAFRYEACDYLLSAYPILGVELVRVFQESATTHLKTRDWRGFEAAMFCIAQLSEAVDDNGHADQCLDTIFGSGAFSQICAGGEVGMPLKARQTLVDTFGKYESYFERKSALLPGVLNILFESLSFEPCALAASRSILTLSKSCARVLTSELPVFLEQLDQFRTKQTATASTMPKVLEGIATIIQRLPADDEKVQTLEKILGFFVQEAKKAREEAASSAYEDARVHGHLVLSCIASIGKGLRAEADEPINPETAHEQNPYPPSFWNAGPGSQVQQLIMEAMRLLIVDFPVDSGLIDSACDILKAGYTESSGLFVFPPSMTVDFIKSFPLGISGTDVIMATASSFLASHASHSMKIRDEAVALIVHVAQLFSSMLNDSNTYDPETANAGIDFLTRLLPKYYYILFSLTDPLPSLAETTLPPPPAFGVLLSFTLHALTRPEPLTLRSASAFWVAMMDLRGSSAAETAAFDQVLEQFIPQLSETLIRQIAGHCARSDLVSLNDVIRRMVFKKMALARPSLTAALGRLNAQTTDANGNQVPVLSPQDKSRFLESLIVARGARPQSMELVRSFWLKCRGMSFDYAQ
ncbi:Armadillo-like helical [Penicillium macrosclerotiorum]|uniref:Armadillo-like helical n=1 Tax=Penicillium macrosclerotiorum TaxID=303699 RepID=UPI0025490A4C|nr:Armadillo-like helical [Penicillium macrosclerotiorum]KAJ5689414.1 Armadillo-like helical [Penicillium macrosclerotiorum]